MNGLNICDTGKEGFVNYSEVGKKIASLRHRGDRHKYGSYKCDRCGNFHIHTVTKHLKLNPKEKYRLDINNIPKKKPIKIKEPHRKVSKIKRIVSTGKIITKEMAETLKRLINNKNKNDD